MQDLIVIGILVIGLFVAVYVGAILVLQQFLHKTKDEAKEIVDKCITKFINMLQENKNVTVGYDVMIGGNGVAIRDEVVNNYFYKLYSLYSDWYYDLCYNVSCNVVCYQFRVFNCTQENFERKRIIYRVKQIAERALTMHFHERGLYGLPVDNFIAVTLCNDVLKVYIACNDAGFEEIQAIRRLPK